MRFKDEFLRGNWLDLNTHALLRPTTKVTAICLTSITFYVYLVDGIYQFVGSPPNEMPKYFTESVSLYTLTITIKLKKYTDNLCFFRNVICARERAKNPKKFKAQKIKAGDVKKLYEDLRTNMSDLPPDSKQFCGFDTPELTKQGVPSFERERLYFRL